MERTQHAGDGEFLAASNTLYPSRLPKEPGESESFYTSALVAAEVAASATKPKYHSDIRLYVEVTLIGERLQMEGSPKPKLLVTDVYKFFKGFIWSPYVHDVLRDLVVEVLSGP